MIPAYIYAQDSGYNSKTWRRLLFFENGKFKAYHHEWFYLSERVSLAKEWELSLDAIRTKKNVGREKILFACAFPARYSYIQKYHPEFVNEKCPSFSEWERELAVKDIYLVYASSYVSNPASMFGHSFLRLSRGGVSRSSALNDYSVGFMALTNNNDSSFSYAIKGITGGYVGNYEVKPFYMNVGLYQSAEDRDLWQYKLNLSQSQVNFFVKILWELSQNTGFSYYFFDENCSSQLLKTLQIVDEDFNFFEGRHFIFAHPIETIKWARASVVEKDELFYPAINKVLRKRLREMTGDERARYQKLKKNINGLDKESSIRVLDALIDFYKFESYRKNSNLKKNEQEIMNAILKRRAALKVVSEKFEYIANKSEEPILFHDPNSLSLGISQVGDDLVGNFDFKLGYHGLTDGSRGHDGFSFIDYLGVKTTFDQDSLKLREVNFVEIHSLAPFLLEAQTYSWNFKMDFMRRDFLLDENHFNLGGALGVSVFRGNSIFFSFFGAEGGIGKDTSRLDPFVKLGLRLRINNLIFLMENKNIYYQENILPNFKFSSSYELENSNVLKLEIENKRGFKDQLEYKAALQIRF